MKKIIVIVLVLFGVGFFGMAPWLVDRLRNQLVSVDLPAVAAPTRALHATLQIADLHSDTLLWRRDWIGGTDRGHVDLPRLLAGNVTLQVFSSVTQVPRNASYSGTDGGSDLITALVASQLQPPRTWTSRFERSLWHAAKLERAAAASDGRLRIIRSPEDLAQLLTERSRGRQVVGALLSIEGLQNLEGNLDNLDKLHAAGFRMAGLAHFFDNDVAGSMHGISRGGLTPLGRQVIVRMEELGMLVDIAHASHNTVAEVLKMARRPVVSSHGGVQATCKTNRNLSDAEIRGIASTGGVVGIGYWDGAVCSTDPRAVAKAIAHVRDLVGIDYVGLGSDFDGATHMAFDTSQLAVITQALVDRGFTPEDIAKVMGGNVLRVLQQGIGPLPGG
jgi:microsomal dipeptidase-like Zn-dependent dipeptidase